jgi:phosphoenolpyruvate phosphomutase
LIDQFDRAAALRAALARNEPVLVAGAHDGLTARLAEEAGFTAVWASGLEISTARGLPDVSLLGLAEFVDAGETIASAVTIPVIADCDTGFGGDMNAAYTVLRYEAAGVAAVCIEDKAFPKRNSFLDDGHDLLSTAAFARKIRMAKGAQTHAEMLVIARTEALVCARPMAEALDRCHAYVDAGADAVLIHSKSHTPEEVLEFLSRWKRRAPVFIVPTTYASLTAEQAYKGGAAAIIYANQGMRASIAATRRMWARVVKEGTTLVIENEIASVSDVFALSGLDSWLAREQAVIVREP